MARRRINVFSLSFLDVMACGLGAIVLFYMIITAQVSTRAANISIDLQAETNKLEEEILIGRKNLIRIRNSLESKKEQQVSAQGEARRLQEILKKLLEELSTYENDSAASIESINKLRSDIERLEKSKRQLDEQSRDAETETGSRIRDFDEGGRRQYLTGIQMGGDRVLFLIDASASMLARTWVNVIRFRSMDDKKKIRAPKWQQTLDTVDWLSTRMEEGKKFQMYVFNEDARSVVEGTEGTWLDVSKLELDRAIAMLKSVVPANGTSLYNVFKAVDEMDPLPDNIYLLTDGLPTQDESPPAQPKLVRADLRRRWFLKATKQLPRGAPVNVILFPMDGDPEAAVFFWDLAAQTRGALMGPSRDWP